MVATNDDLLLEMQKHTTILKDIKKLLKGQYSDPLKANEEILKEV